ncbi:MAG: hypothetical protein NZ750_12025 [Anaerolineae bacterium]|nr:hypothetical protein [Anaerolineae bacterium]MDW8173910.1 hypothetical protein [Anaerolineae bacterium]
MNIIYDLRMADEPELSLMNMNNMRKNINPEAHKGWTIIVTPKPNPIMESIVSILSQVLRVRLCVIKDYEEALRFLFEVDATLPPMPANTAP